MPVQTLTQVDPQQFFNLLSTKGTGIQRLDTQVGGIAVSNELSGRLSVTTAEGDKITLTANLEAEFRAGVYQSHSEADGTSVDVDAKTFAYSLKKEINVTVEGDLNEDEKKDLADLFRKVSKIFRKFFNGQDDAALAKTVRLADRFGSLSSLSSLDLNVDVQRSVSVGAAHLTEQGGVWSEAAAAVPNAPAATDNTETTQTATPGAAPSTAAEIPPPSTGTTAPTQPSVTKTSSATPEAAGATVPAPESQTHRSLIQQVLDAVKEANLESNKLRKYLPRVLDKVREELLKDLREKAEAQQKQTLETPSFTGSAGFLTYRSTHHTSVTLSIRT